MSVDEIRRAGEFSVDEGLPVIYALYASGLLVRATVRSAKVDAGETVKSSAELRVELDRMLASYRDFDYYDILQIARHADSSEVKRAYYLLAKQYHPDRHRNEADPDVLEKLEAVFAQIGRAYDTLKDDRLRVDYDRRLGAGTAKIPPLATPAAPPRSVSATAPPPRPAAPSAEPHAAPRPAATPAAHSAPPAQSVHATATPIAHGGPSEPSLTTHQLAERSFQEGLLAYQNRDVLRAIHLFRDAVRQAPEKGTYHVHLGVALTSNPRWYKEAEKHLLEAARTDPLNLQVFLKLGMIYQDGGLKKRAEAQYRQALGIDPYNRIARKALIDMGFEAPPVRSGSGAKESSTGGLLSKLFKKK
jgi:curved DNA-binding protein CbpA